MEEVTRMTHSAGAPAAAVMALPAPRCPVTVRPAVAEDLPFIDQLQKMHTFMVGFLHRKAMEQKIESGQVLVAEQVASCKLLVASEDAAGGQPATNNQQPATPVGYCIAQDQYSGRDDVGIIYQLNVMPLRQRHLIGASLIKAVFERAAYGCRLFSCWCAQDIQANWFWEAIGFVPLAFRTGSASKQRIHIFWQRRVREDDRITPYWFPSQTKSGQVREDRLVLPIPPGTHWRDAKPIILPGMQDPAQPALPPSRPPAEKKKFVAKVPVIAPPSKFLQETPAGKAAVVTGSGIRYVDRGDYVPPPEPAKPKREPKPRVKNDPKLVKAARELRDKYLEELNRHALPCYGKYDVSRGEVLDVPTMPRLLAG
jgi:GNAT superfamily N-acetyltransferase